MKILHTSDWHIGRTLYGRKRYEEFESFLTWLENTIRDYDINVLLVAGDVFDTSAPSNHAQELYYHFLNQVSHSSCRHVVIIAGNHDSPSFLNAPKELLKDLSVHVIGCTKASLQDEVLVLRNEQDVPELIVCAVPYLRDKDIRISEAGESIEDKEQKLADGIRSHYATVATLAEEKRKELGLSIPIVGMGHLFTAGGQTVDGDGVRELYIGSLAHVTADMFPASFGYLALGHLHVPQKVTGLETIRYSGSPLPMGFGEATQKKSVCLLQLEGEAAAVQLLEVPIFQKLERIMGDWDKILSHIHNLAAQKARCWLEVIYSGAEIMSDLRERLETEISGTQIEILRIQNDRIIERVLKQIHDADTLDNLNINEVFQRCLDIHKIPDDQRPELLLTYQETLTSLQDDDVMAE